jgi:DNA-binding MarR family transcriptional regulator
VTDLHGRQGPASYWFDPADPAVGILAALRRFRTADRDMRRQMSAGMDMNATDVDALRFVIARELAGEQATPRTLADYLEISSASTTKLLDRLTASGHLLREPHPEDRRSVIVRATDHAHHEVRARMALMHRRMLEIARAVPEQHRTAVADFLDAMAECLRDDTTLGSSDPGPAPTTR